MAAPTDAELTDAWTAATRNAVTALFAEYPDHHFYYLSLAVSDESLPPFLVAMSEEMLAQVRSELAGPGSDSWVEARWNYSYSPVLPYGWDDHYAEVRRLLELRPDLGAMTDDEQWDAEYLARMAALEAAVSRLDGEGLFGSGERRAGVLVLVENVPWDDSNVERVRRMNPRGPLRQEWLEYNEVPETMW